MSFNIFNIRIKARTLRLAIASATLASDTESTRYVLGGCLVEFGESGIKFIATDCRKMHIVELHPSQVDSVLPLGGSFVLDAKTCKALKGSSVDGVTVLSFTDDRLFKRGDRVTILPSEFGNDTMRGTATVLQVEKNGDVLVDFEGKEIYLNPQRFAQRLELKALIPTGKKGATMVEVVQREVEGRFPNWSQIVPNSKYSKGVVKGVASQWSKWVELVSNPTPTFKFFQDHVGSEFHLRQESQKNPRPILTTDGIAVEGCFDADFIADCLTTCNPNCPCELEVFDDSQTTGYAFKVGGFLTSVFCGMR